MVLVRLDPHHEHSGVGFLQPDAFPDANPPHSSGLGTGTKDMLVAHPLVAGLAFPQHNSLNPTTCHLSRLRSINLI